MTLAHQNFTVEHPGEMSSVEKKNKPKNMQGKNEVDFEQIFISIKDHIKFHVNVIVMTVGNTEGKTTFT